VKVEQFAHPSGNGKIWGPLGSTTRFLASVGFFFIVSAAFAQVSAQRVSAGVLVIFEF
jgi:hypothetical protein